jgi:hypothetical protein
MGQIIMPEAATTFMLDNLDDVQHHVHGAPVWYVGTYHLPTNY